MGGGAHSTEVVFAPSGPGFKSGVYSNPSSSAYLCKVGGKGLITVIIVLIIVLLLKKVCEL